MTSDTKRNILGVLIDSVDYQAAVARVIEAAKAGKPLSVSALAVHGVMTGALDHEQRYRLNGLDLIVPDGQPVRWALNLLHGCGLKDRVYGPNLMLKVCGQAAQEGLPVFLYGSRPVVLEPLERALKTRYPNLIVAGSRPSAFKQLSRNERAGIAEQIRASGARLVLVGLGCPRQEVWVFEHRDLLPMPLLALGAAFDFHAGMLPQAPRWMQDHGLEWCFRLWQEPNRLWRRYILLNPAYLFLLFLQFVGFRQLQANVRALPPDELGYG